MKPAVLCISAAVAASITSIGQIKEEDLHFLNRKTVDDKEDITIGALLPQVIPSIVIQFGCYKYLSY